MLVSGTAGTGKSSIAAHFADAACGRGERVIYFSFEESPSQTMRNMRSIGIDLQPWVKKGLLRFHANRPSFAGLETHLVMKHKAIDEFEPQVVILDPLNSFSVGGNEIRVQSMLTRLLGFLKTDLITGLFTNLTSAGGALRAEFEPQEAELRKIIGQEQAQGAQTAQGRVDMGLSREEDAAAKNPKRGSK